VSVRLVVGSLLAAAGPVLWQQYSCSAQHRILPALIGMAGLLLVIVVSKLALENCSARSFGDQGVKSSVRCLIYRHMRLASWRVLLVFNTRSARFCDRRPAPVSIIDGVS